MPINPEEVRHVARLARVGLSDEDVSRFQGQLSQILDYFQMLHDLETDGVPPTSHPLPLHNVMRTDSEDASLPRDAVLGNAPQQEAGLFRVSTILEE